MGIGETPSKRPYNTETGETPEKKAPSSRLHSLKSSRLGVMWWVTDFVM